MDIKHFIALGQVKLYIILSNLQQPLMAFWPFLRNLMLTHTWTQWFLVNLYSSLLTLISIHWDCKCLSLFFVTSHLNISQFTSEKSGNRLRTSPSLEDFDLMVYPLYHEMFYILPLVYSFNNYEKGLVCRFACRCFFCTFQNNVPHHIVFAFKFSKYHTWMAKNYDLGPVL